MGQNSESESGAAATLGGGGAALPSPAGLKSAAVGGPTHGSGRGPGRAQAGALACVLDGALLAAGYGLNFWVWLGFIRLGHIPPEYVRLFGLTVVPLVALRLVLLWGAGLYRTLTPHLGFHELTVIGAANTAATGALAAFNLLTPWIASLGPLYPMDAGGTHVLRLPWGIVFNDWMLSLIVLGGVRFLRHQYDAAVMRGRSAEARRALIVGVGDAAARVARDLAAQTQGRHVPVGFIDPAGDSEGMRIHGIAVLGGLEAMEEAARREGVSEAIIALDSASPRIVREVVERLGRLAIALQIVPDLESLVSGRVQVSALRAVGIEDLLGRSEVRLGAGGGHPGLRGRRVLITGAGGSIGRELTRQAMASDPAALILIDLSENNLFELIEDIEDEAQRRGLAVHEQVGDVTDARFVERLFEGLKPEIVFHAAAHKHVHLMESQPAEAVRNNVGGTLTVAEAAARHGVERLVYVSTDKAVRPTGVMGRTKRVGELIVGALGAEHGRTFLSVRFGNVLGSRGSVLPTFRRQIERGGPVTVTHRDATRYFMTVDEAVSLLIEAGTGGAGGSVLILNMGKPVRIDELARSLIRLSGYEPERDIAIVYTGLRPGERLSEELVSAGEASEPALEGRVWIARDAPPAWEKLEPAVRALLAAAEAHDNGETQRRLKAALEEFGGGRED